MNFSTTPPWASTWRRAVAKYAVSIRSTSSGSAPSEVAVKPTRSQNRAETTLRSSVSWLNGPASGAAHALQNRDPAGFVVPQDAHAIMGAKHMEPGTEPEEGCRRIGSWIRRHAADAWAEDRGSCPTSAHQARTVPMRRGGTKGRW